MRTLMNTDVIKVLFVCHGNICRSTMAESLFTHMVQEAGLEGRFVIASAATSRDEIGNPVHHGTVAKLKEKHIPLVPHAAVQMTMEDVRDYDYILAMDDNNMRNMKRQFGLTETMYKTLQFAGSERDIADPWYTGDFEATYQDLETGLQAFLKYVTT